MMTLITGRSFSAAWMLSIFLAFCANSAPADESSEDFNLGVNLYRSQRYDTAAETFRSFLKANPEHPRAVITRLFLGLSLSETKQYLDSRRYFLEYLELAPDDANAVEARYRVGECSFHLRDFSAATEQLTEFLSLHAEHRLADWALLLLGDSQYALERYSAARLTLEKIVPGRPQSPVTGEAALSLGRVLEKLALPAEALTLYNTIAIDDKSPLRRTALTRVANLHYTQQDYPAASATWDEYFLASKNLPIPETASLGAGMSLYRCEEYGRARGLLEKVPAQSALAPQARYFSALCEISLNQPDAARKQFMLAMEAAGDMPIGADIAFQQAQLEQKQGDSAAAMQIFTDIADRWPTHRLTLESLFNAAEIQLLQEQPEAAERIWRRMTETDAEFAAQPRSQILLGRLQIKKKTPEDAVKTLSAVLQQIPTENTELTRVGHYQLVRAAYDARLHEQAVTSCRALLTSTNDDDLMPFLDALALATVSSLELKQYEPVDEFGTRFLQLGSDREQAPDIRAGRAVARTALGKTAVALTEFTELCQEHPDRNQVWSSVLTAAEMLLESKTPAEAEAFFQLATTHPEAADVQEAGLSGVAWTQYRSSRPQEAEVSFQKLLTAFPNSKDLVQNRFMLAKSIDDQQDDERSAAAWVSAWQAMAEGLKPVAADAEKQPPVAYVFDAGRTAARKMQQVGKLDEAAAVWTKLLATFPASTETPAMLDEWAWMHISAEQFDKSDEIYRRLVRDFPESVFSGEARLSLAESQLQAGELEQPLAEMQSLATATRFSEYVRERARFHVVEIFASTGRWNELKTESALFLEEWPSSEFAPRARLFLADSLLQSGEAVEATAAVEQLQAAIKEGTVPAEEWTHRAWVVQAEILLATANYAAIDAVEEEFRRLSPDSRFLFQILDVQGRRWKQQPRPDFEKSRDYLRRVTADPSAAGTETAARCQTLIADTFLLQKNFEDAVREYFKVYLSYPYDSLRAMALYQAAACEIRLKKNAAAVRDLEELIEKFPNEDVAKLAREQLSELNKASATE